MLRLVLFDIDGTLIHSGGAGTAAFGRAFATQFNIANSAAGLKFAGRTDFGLARELFCRQGKEPTKDNLRSFFELYSFWLAQLLPDTGGGILPGVLRLIHELRSRPEPPMLGLLTGNIRLGAEIKLRHFNLWEFFETGAFGDDHEDRNEIAAIALLRASRLHGRQIRGDEVLVIGDTPLDIACGRAIGAKTLAVAAGGFTLADLQSHQPTWAVANLEVVKASVLCAM